MSKERLEEILKESPFIQHTEEFLIKLEDMNEITKIVEELEKVEYALQEMYRQERQHSERLEKENQRLKQVLEFYANEKNYERAYDNEVLFDYLPSEIDFDNGKKARKALEESE